MSGVIQDDSGNQNNERNAHVGSDTVGGWQRGRVIKRALDIITLRAD